MQAVKVIVRIAFTALFVIDVLRAKKAMNNRETAETAYYMGWAVLMYLGATE